MKFSKVEYESPRIDTLLGLCADTSDPAEMTAAAAMAAIRLIMLFVFMMTAINVIYLFKLRELTVLPAGSRYISANLLSHKWHLLLPYSEYQE